MAVGTNLREFVEAVITATGGGGGAPASASYVTLGTDATLTSERVLTAGAGITLTDAGAGSTVTVGVTAGTYAAASHTHAAADITSGTIATARLGSGSATSATYLHGDQTWGGLAAADLTGTVAAARLGSGSTGGLDQWQTLCADGVWRINGGPWIEGASKTADTTLSTTGLTMSGLPVGHYRLRVELVHVGNATGGIKLQVACTNATARWRAMDRDGGTVTNTEASTPNYSASAGEQMVIMVGNVEVTSSTGTVDIHMAQNSSHATPTVINWGTMSLQELTT